MSTTAVQQQTDPNQAQNQQPPPPPPPQEQQPPQPPQPQPPQPPQQPKQPEFIAPNNTLYINNLNDKIKMEEMKKQLYELFSQFGPILEIVMNKARRMRGQAFIVFKDINTATLAMRKMNGFEFNGKPLVINYAKTKSDATAKLDGTYHEQKRKRDELAQKKLEEEREKKKQKSEKKKKKKGKKSSGIVPIIPNNILFLENLGDKITKEALELLFQNFPGFKEVRLVPGKSGIAFVEYENEIQAGTAMSNLQGFKCSPTHLMKISYAKK